RGSESAEIVSPFPQKLAVAALGYSASTGPGGMTGEIAYFDSVDALRAAPNAAVRGKIVFIDHHMMPTQDGSGYGQFGAPRRQGPTIASKKGALGIVIRSIGTDHHRNPHTGVQYFTDGATPIPAGALTVPDAEQLIRILKRGQPVIMHLTLVSRKSEGGHSGNVVAEIPGRDPNAPIPLDRHRSPPQPAHRRPIFHRRRDADPGRRPDGSRRRAAHPHPQARPARHHAPDAGEPEIRRRTLGQRRRRDPRPRSERADPARSAPITTATRTPASNISPTARRRSRPAP